MGKFFGFILVIVGVGLILFQISNLQGYDDYGFFPLVIGIILTWWGGYLLLKGSPRMAAPSLRYR